MNELFALIRQFIQSLRLWVMISPWEAGVRVRFGKWAKPLRPGFHLALPLFDVFYIQSVRPRISSLGRQTVETLDGKPLTITGGIQYAIGSVEKLYQTLDHAEDTLMQLSRAHVSEYISRNKLHWCKPRDLEEEVSKSLATELSKYGLTDVRLCISDWMVGRVYRIVDNQSWGNCGGILQTNVPLGRQ